MRPIGEGAPQHQPQADMERWPGPVEATDSSPTDARPDGTADPLSAEGLDEQLHAETPSDPATQQPKSSNVRHLLVEIIQTVLLTLIIFAGVRSIVQNFKVDGASMEPTLHSGQYLLINKVAYLRLDGAPLEIVERTGLVEESKNSYFPFGGPQRGDIIVFRYPGYPDRDFIKRVIALPGDVVQVDKGRVYVNGTPMQEDYILSTPTYSLPKQTVPEENYFVLGDNRPNSSDSHIWGFVPEANLIGRAWLSYWPPGTWGELAHADMAGD